jgi:FkbM family methyltransferase
MVEFDVAARVGRPGMPLFVKTPRNETVLRQSGPYASGLSLMDRKQTAVQRQITRDGLAGYEPETQATLLTLAQLSVKPVEFFDVGAHIGLYSTLLATVFPADLLHVTAFEPTPETAEICAAVAAANHVEVHLERVAVSDEMGRAPLYISDKAETSNSLRPGFRDSTQSVDVATTTLDQYCLDRGTTPTVLKIDVQTQEAAALRGARETLAQARPSIVCEMLPAGDDAARAAVLHDLDALGYRAHAWQPAKGWVEHKADEIPVISEAHRDWLFTRDTLGDSFHTAFQQWSTAIAECGQDHNILVPGGSPPPDGWNAPYLPERPERGSRW